MITFAKKQITPASSEIISALFILLFVYTATSKLIHFEQFKNVLSSSPLISRYAYLVSAAVPLTELTVAGFLFFPSTRSTGFFLSFLLMAVFTTYVACMIIFSSHLPCSCGGIIQQLSWKQHLPVNIILTLLSIYAFRQHKLFIAIKQEIPKTCDRVGTIIN